MKISPNEIEKQGNKLFIIKNKEKILLYIKGIISIIEQFKLKKTDFYDSLIYLRNILNDDNFLENIDNIENNITKFDVKLINDINNPIISFITLMFENDNFLPFIISKTEEDIKKIEELAGEIDNQKVTNSDIKKLIEIISFKEILKKFTNKNDEDFLKQFEKELENSNTLIVSLNDISKKFKDIEELFIKTMDISGYSKIIIHHIILSSEFKIENINNEYKCSIKYIYDEKQNTTKEKSLREILETKDKILLRQKRKNKEDKSENEIKQFLQIIDEIEKVLELLETISSKGYIEEINCIITIENGNEKCKCNNKEHDSIKSLIHSLESIFEQQKKDENNSYSNHNYIRLLYGKQLSQIYHNLFNKENMI